MDDGTIIWPRIYSRQLSLLNMAKDRFQAQIAPYKRRLTDEFQKWQRTNTSDLQTIFARSEKEGAGCGDSQACLEAVRARTCASVNLLAKQSNAAMGQVWNRPQVESVV